jgi:hypothetical protein
MEPKTIRGIVRKGERGDGRRRTAAEDVRYRAKNRKKGFF